MTANTVESLVFPGQRERFHLVMIKPGSGPLFLVVAGGTVTTKSTTMNILRTMTMLTLIRYRRVINKESGKINLGIAMT